MNWPNDANGHMLQRLESHGLDFHKPHIIDFNIEFDDWPLPIDTIEALIKMYPDCEFIDPDQEDIMYGHTHGYVQFKITDTLTYDLVTEIQKKATQYLKPFGGQCVSWGVLDGWSMAGA